MSGVGALVGPALGHCGQLVVPLQNDHLLGGLQVVFFVLPVPDSPPDFVVNSSNLILLGLRHAALHTGGGTAGAGAVGGVQTHGVRSGLAGWDVATAAVVGGGRSGGHHHRQQHCRYLDRHLQQSGETVSAFSVLTEELEVTREERGRSVSRTPVDA